MTVHRLLALCGLAALATGCGDDNDGSTSPSQNVAYVRYVNAVADTSGVDFRFVDDIDLSPMFPSVLFRQYTPYQAAGAGARHIKVFINPAPYRPDSSAIVSKLFLVDTTVSFEPNAYYTILHAGLARAGQTPRQQLYVIKDDIPAKAGGKISVRTINAAYGFGAADVFTTTETSTTPFASAIADLNVPVITSPTTGITAYRDLDARPRTPATSTYKVWYRKTGVATPVVGDSASRPMPTLMLQGAAAIDTVAGSQVDSTAFTALLLPRSVAGSKAPVADSTLSILFMVDRVGRKP